MTMEREVRTLPSESRSRSWPSWLDRLWTRRMNRNVVHRIQACCQISCASLAPLTPWEKPG
jgi:hypothetical protein